MANLCARIKGDTANKYRRITDVGELLYSPNDIHIQTATPYAPGVALEDGEWFSVSNASCQEYKTDLMDTEWSSIDFESLSGDDFDNISFVFVELGDVICFQNITKAKLVAKKSVLCLGQDYVYRSSRKELVINNIPDALYDKNTDILYFRRLERVTGIFKGIDQLYKEATEEETSEFLTSSFILLKDGYDTSKVKTANRKRIALARETLRNLDEQSRNNIFAYIGAYCPNLKVSDTSFEVGSEGELKMLLYGIEQRFYTTIVGGEKRIANSIVPLE